MKRWLRVTDQHVVVGTRVTRLGLLLEDGRTAGIRRWKSTANRGQTVGTVVNREES